MLLIIIKCKKMEMFFELKINAKNTCKGWKMWKCFNKHNEAIPFECEWIFKCSDYKLSHNYPLAQNLKCFNPRVFSIQACSTLRKKNSTKNYFTDVRKYGRVNHQNNKNKLKIITFTKQPDRSSAQQNRLQKFIMQLQMIIYVLNCSW